MPEIYRKEDPAEAIARLRAESEDLQAQNASMRQRLQEVEARLGIRPPVPPSSLRVKVAIAVGALFAGAAVLMMVLATRRVESVSNQDPDPASQIGVPACDAYLAKWNACYTDPTMRAAVRPSFDQVRQAWTKMASDPNQRSALGNACSQMLASFPETSCQTAAQRPPPSHAYEPPPEPPQAVPSQEPNKGRSRAKPADMGF
jgi:hypothetical protein